MHISDCCQFSDIQISQGSVATYLRFGGIFKYEFVANYQWVCQWKNFENRLTFVEVMGKSLVSCFFETYARCNRIFTIHYLEIFQWKNVLNRFIFDIIVAVSLWPHFIGPPCIQLGAVVAEVAWRVSTSICAVNDRRRHQWNPTTAWQAFRRRSHSNICIEASGWLGGAIHHRTV